MFLPVGVQMGPCKIGNYEYTNRHLRSLLNAGEGEVLRVVVCGVVLVVCCCSCRVLCCVVLVVCLCV